MAIIFKLTDAGRAALVNAQSTGSAARTLVSVGVTATAFAPTTNLVALPGEIKRLTTIAGDVVADGTIHVTIRDDGPDAYTVRGFGLWLDDGVLLGTYSQPTAIVEKSGASIMMMSTDLRVLDGSADVSTLQFGNTNFIDPPATTERQGVVELATLDEVTAGTDDVRAVTPYTMARRLALKADLTGADFSGAVSATGFSGSGGALTDLAWKNIVGRPTTLAGYGITDGASGTRRINAGTGLTGGGDLSADRTLALAGTGVNAGSYGSATGVATFTVDAQGRLTAAGSVAIAPGWASITAKPTTLDGYGITDAMRSNALDDRTLQSEGWQLLPGGFLMQWGTATLPATLQNTSTIVVNFPKRFPVGPVGVFPVALEGANSTAGGVPSMLSQKLTPSSAEIAGDCLAYTTFNKTCTIKWFAIGR